MNSKKCYRCNKNKPFTEFYKNKNLTDGYFGKCKDCYKSDVRANYREKKLYYKEYDKTRQRMNIKRILSHRYNLMKARTTGKAGRPYEVEGKPMLTKEEWETWNNLPEVKVAFSAIYTEWVESGFRTNLMPSVDRIDNNKGYELDNIQWLSKHDNSIKHTKEFA